MTVKKIDLALQGGGAHGAYTWGVIDRLLDDERLEIDGICGTSAGAMNAVCTLYGLTKGGRGLAKHTLVKFWHKISEAGRLSMLQPSWLDKAVSPGNMDFSWVYKFFSFTSENLAPSQFNPLGINPLEKILNELIDFEELQRISPPKLFVCATNVKTCEARVFGPSEISVKAILASACLPYLFHPVEINGESYWDGGYMGNPPLWPLTKGTAGTEDILLVRINPFKIKNVPSSIEEIKDRVNELSFNSSLKLEMEHLEFVNQLVEQGITLNDSIKKINLHSISADDDLADLNLSSKLNTTWDFLMHLKNLGYANCDKWLAQNFESIGNKSSFKL
jgi:NTE family protein